VKTDTHVISTESACLGAREAIPWLRQGRYSGEGKQCRPVLATMSIEGTEAALSGMRNSCFESSPTILQLTRLPEGLLFSACGILYAHHSHEATRPERPFLDSFIPVSCMFTTLYALIPHSATQRPRRSMGYPARGKLHLSTSAPSNQGNKREQQCLDITLSSITFGPHCARGDSRARVMHHQPGPTR